MSSVFVTVGMGPWPFDRLVRAVAPLCTEHDVFVQTGTSRSCRRARTQRFLGPAETLRRITDADVVITHGGNTVRLVQRAGKVPIAVAREAARGEMRNDHQVAYLVGGAGRRPGPRARRGPAGAGGRGRGPSGRAVPDARRRGRRCRRRRTRSGWSSRWTPRCGRPAARSTGTRWPATAGPGRSSPPVPAGTSTWASATATFTAALHRDTKLDVVAVDAHPDYLRELRAAEPHLPLARVGTALPFATGAFDSVSALDVLEHVADEAGTLAELHRVLRPGGLLVLTVPARHAFSVLDPDNAKLTVPRLHRAVYQRRFGRAEYERRFVDAANGLRGDMAWDRPEHTNYRATELLAALAAAGFEPTARDGAGLYWRLVQVPALLLPRRLARLLDAPQRLDARLFRRANLFLTATRR